VKTSDNGIHLMHEFEGYRNKPYRCSADIWTVGWGHAMYPDQIRLPYVRREGYEGMLRKDYPLRPEDNRVWTREELVELFKVDIASFERGVLRMAPTLAGHQSKFDACVALSYNIGLGNFQKSTIRQKLLREDWEGAADGFLTWSKANGKVVAGLVRRRKAEIALFNSA